MVSVFLANTNNFHIDLFDPQMASKRTTTLSQSKLKRYVNKGVLPTTPELGLHHQFSLLPKTTF